MSSPGVLREVPCAKNTVVSSAIFSDYLKPQVLDYDSYVSSVSLDKTQISNGKSKEKSSSMLDDVLGRILKRRKTSKKKTQMTVKKFDAEMDKFVNSSLLNVAVVESSSTYKMMAMSCFALGKDLEACCYLIASHAACLRQQIMYRTMKMSLRHTVLSEPMVNNLDVKDLDTDHVLRNTNPATLVATLKELPTEWYVVQITAEHENLKHIRRRVQPEETAYSLKPSHGLYIMTLPTGKNASYPVCVEVPKPCSDSKYDIRTEVESLLNSNKSDLSNIYNNNDLYWKMRRRQNEQMNAAITELEFSWLREWRVLLLADYLECLDLVKDIHDMIDKLIADSSIKEFPVKTRWLLKKIACGACHLQPYEIERAVKKLLPKQEKLAKNMILSIVAKIKVMEPLKTAKRKTLILIVDECLDLLSFESIKLLKHQPVTRFPSLHIAYALFKQHQGTIQAGYKIIKKSEDLGTFIVNPSSDLVKMENRMKSFIQYWLPNWKGLYGAKPELEFFKNALKLCHVLLYSGHGSGIQFLNGEEIERMRVLASVLLFGCSSIKLIPAGGRMPAYGVSNQYLMACSPCILGMLWEVTDGDIDLMTAKFMSKWASSENKRSWNGVKESLWYHGKLEFQGRVANVKNEPDMLLAVAKSKDVCKQYMTSAAIVVRGLPVKLVD
ncbi:hypothetical protein TSAR_010098 [Trichomalopsis sarcophagae]|uniref:separase n=1 Tax=Trichomalopsis sarcophagae TaxID=543379 RepID=A0A232FFM2_9HYME|nr:hypothetical protein TSAR_010098 [Trichomalopsis sarcophagae]